MLIALCYFFFFFLPLCIATTVVYCYNVCAAEGSREYYSSDIVLQQCCNTVVINVAVMLCCNTVAMLLLQCMRRWITLGIHDGRNVCSNNSPYVVRGNNCSNSVQQCFTAAIAAVRCIPLLSCADVRPACAYGTHRPSILVHSIICG